MAQSTAAAAMRPPGLLARIRRYGKPGSAVWAFQRDRVAVASLAVAVTIVLAACAAQWITPYAAQGLGIPDTSSVLLPPSPQHPFGTDEVGRDELARVLFGARSSLLIGFVVVAIGVAIGTMLGVIAGFVGGFVDEAIMRFTDLVLSFPPLLLAIALAATLQPSVQSAIIAIAATWWPWYTRIVRAETVSVRERQYVAAAKAMGAPSVAIIWSHVVPNILAPVRVQAGLDVGSAILTGAAISFLGLGPQPPTADWGVMVSSGREYLVSGQWWMSIFPGLAIFIAVAAFNLLGDGLRSVMDPQTRELP